MTTQRSRSLTPGSVTERAPGVWRIRVTTGTVGGRQRRQTATVHGTRRDAEKARVKLLHDAGETVHVADSTVGDLWELWTASVSHRWSPNTVGEHARIQRRLDDLMDTRADQLAPKQVEWCYATLSKTLAPGTVRRTHATLRACLAWAEKRDLIGVSPMHKVSSPLVPPSNVKAADPKAVAEFLRWAKANLTPRYYALWRLAATTGARRGELIGLRFEDLRDGRLTIQRVVVKGPEAEVVIEGRTKGGGTRSVALDQASIDAIEAIDGNYGFIFSNDGNTPWPLDRATRMFRRHQRQAEVEIGHLHMLRHGHATQALAAGFSVRQVADRLGHANPAMTLQVYAKSLPAQDQELADRLGGMF